MPSPWTSSLFRNRRGPVRLNRARGGLARYLLLVLLPLVLGPLITFALLVYRQAQTDITTQVNNQLTSLASLKEKQIELWAVAHASDMNNLARTPDIAQAAKILATNSQPNELSIARLNLTSHLDEYLARNPDYEAILLLSADGVVLFSTTLHQHLMDT